MVKDTITLTLNGDVPLALFAVALDHLNELVTALSEELIEPDEAAIQWQVLHLASGSAVTTIKGIVQEAEPTSSLYPTVEKIVEAYVIIGKALQFRQPIPFSEDVARPARELTSVLNGHITSIEFITDGTKALIKEKVTEESSGPKKYCLGVVKGVVRTISDKPRLKLGVYDELFNRMVYCYLAPTQEDLARSAWRKQVSITGLLYRDSETGRPVEFREVYDVQVLKNTSSGSYKEARGVLPWETGDEPAEVSIRRLRDA